MMRGCFLPAGKIAGSSDGGEPAVGAMARIVLRLGGGGRGWMLDRGINPSGPRSIRATQNPGAFLKASAVPTPTLPPIGSPRCLTGQ